MAAGVSSVLSPIRTVLVKCPPLVDAVVPARALSSNRCAVTKVKRELYSKTFDSALVLPDGATISVRYAQPRQVIRLPIDVNQCSKAEMRRILMLRTPRDKRAKEEVFTSTKFDPRQYIKKK